MAKPSWLNEGGQGESQQSDPIPAALQQMLDELTSIIESGEEPFDGQGSGEADGNGNGESDNPDAPTPSVPPKFWTLMLELTKRTNKHYLPVKARTV